MSKKTIKILKTILCVTICICLATAAQLSIFGDDVALDQVVDSQSGVIVSNDSGEVSISKSAVQLDKDLFEITLQVITQDDYLAGVDKSGDVVLVLDVSVSMNSGSRFTSMVTAAKAFVNSFMETNPNNRVSIVVYGGTSKVELSLSNDKAALLAKLDALTRISGTNIQAGVIAGATELGLSTKTNKFMVVLSDGEANRKDSSAPNGYTPEYYTGFEISDISSSAKAAIYSARNYISSGIEIYSIFIGNSGNGSKTMANIASPGNYLGSVTDADLDELTERFEYAAGVIIDTIGTPTIDKMGDYIEFVSFSDPDEDDAYYTEGTKTLYWNMNDFEEDGLTKTYTMKYIVKLDTTLDGFEDDVAYDTNAWATLYYKIGDGEQETLNYPKPTVKGKADVEESSEESSEDSSEESSEESSEDSSEESSQQSSQQSSENSSYDFQSRTSSASSDSSSYEMITSSTPLVDGTSSYTPVTSSQPPLSELPDGGSTGISALIVIAGCSVLALALVAASEKKSGKENA